MEIVIPSDLAKPRVAEEQPPISASTVRALLESSTQSVIAVAADGTIILANPSTEKMFGYSPEELVGQPMEILVPESARGRHSEHQRTYFHDMRSRPMGIGQDLAGRRKDGTTFPVEIGLSSVEMNTDRIAIAFVTDITQRKHAEEALRQSEERFRLVIEGARLGTFDVDPRTGEGICSPFAKQHLALAADAEPDAGTAARTVHPDDLGRVQHLLAAALQPEHGGNYAMEFRVIGLHDGVERWISVWGKTLFNREGYPLRVIGMTQDLTARKRLEESLRQREREVSTVLDDTPDLIIRLDRQSRFTYVNAKTASVAGIPRDAFRGKTAAEVGLPTELIDLWTPVTEQTFETGKPGTLEFSYPGPAGATDWEERFIPEFAPDGSVESILIIGRDVTERQRLEKVTSEHAREIQSLAASLLTAQQEERRRVSRELHDQICQQLAALAIEIGGLAAKPPPSKDISTRLKAIQVRVIKASDEARHLAYQMHPSILDDLGLVASLRELCSQFVVRAPGVKLKFNDASRPATVPRVAASCAYSIAQECLENIVKHSRAQLVSIGVAVTQETLQLTIADDGAGFQLQAAKGRGGLGLIGMEERARLVNGNLRIDSQPGHGTRVTLSIRFPEAGL